MQYFSIARVRAVLNQRNNMGFHIVPVALRPSILGALLTLTACATAPPQQSYNRAANSQIKTIRVLPMRESETGLFFNSPGMQFGLIGALIATGDMASKRSRLVQNLAAEHFDPQAIFKARFNDTMQRRGYTILWPVPMTESQASKVPRERWGERKAYAALSDADAQLDVNFGFMGYAAAGAGKSAPYRPTVSMSARLVSADGRAKLFSETLNYNTIGAFNVGNPINISPDPACAYPNFSDLQVAGASSAQCLTAAIEAVADKLAEQL